MSIKVSVCIICKNEEDKLEACLKSLDWADEIVVLDSGSTDNTLRIAEKYTKSIYSNDDWPGFGPQRQRAEKFANNDWLFAIDADEVVSPELAQAIKKTLENANEKTVYRVNRLTNFCGKFIYHSGWYPDKIVRLYNRKHYHYNDKMVHESVACKGAKQVDIKGPLYHYTFSDLALYLRKRSLYAQAWAEENYKKGKKTSLSRAVLSSVFAFFRHYVLSLGVLDGRTGFLIAVIQMQYTFNKYAQLRYKWLNKNITPNKSK